MSETVEVQRWIFVVLLLLAGAGLHNVGRLALEWWRITREKPGPPPRQ